MNDNILKVSSKSNPNSVAGALSGMIKEKKVIELHAIGAGAVNQAVKAIAIARGFVATVGYNMVCIPAFGEAEVAGEEKSTIKLIVKLEV